MAFWFSLGKKTLAAIRTIYGLCTDHLRTMYGVTMEYLWSIYGVTMEYLRGNPQGALYLQGFRAVKNRYDLH
jgi:hypothetical protein